MSIQILVLILLLVILGVLRRGTGMTTLASIFTARTRRGRGVGCPTSWQVGG
jgi:hypothetical protein